jgi:uncharacterized membrane protein YqgA involved in biofilm formation
MLGTIINALAVISGSSLGLLMRRSIGEDLKGKLLSVIGLFILYLGADMMLRADKPLGLIIGLLLGTYIGHIMKLDERLERLSNIREKSADGLLVPFLTFCIGPMTVIGSLRDGMGDPSIILAKSVMDGFSSIAFASAFGFSVLLSAIPLLLFQGSLSLLGRFIGNSLPLSALEEMTAAGGIILLGLALRILGIKRINVADMLPSLLIAPLISQFL